MGALYPEERVFRETLWRAYIHPGSVRSQQ